MSIPEVKPEMKSKLNKDPIYINLFGIKIIKSDYLTKYKTNTMLILQEIRWSKTIETKTKMKILIEVALGFHWHNCAERPKEGSTSDLHLIYDCMGASEKEWVNSEKTIEAIEWLYSVRPSP